MKRTKKLLTGIIVMVFVFFSGISKGQTKNDAINEYNLGAQNLNTNQEEAIAHFEKCIEIADQLGEEGQETKDKAQAGLSMIPGAYLKKAMSFYKEKDYENAINAFEMTVETAGKYNDPNSGKKAKSAIPQLYWAKGNESLKNKEYEGAVAEYDKAIELNPSYGKAFLNRGLAFKGMDDLENMKSSLDKAIEFSMGKDEKTVSTAEEQVRISYFNAGVMAVQEKDWAKAESFLNTSIEYGNADPDIFLKMGEISNELGNFEKAIGYLEKGIGLVEGDAAAKAGFYFHMGNAYKGLNNKEKACESYKNAEFGDYAQNAKYQRETVLKCQ